MKRKRTKHYKNTDSRMKMTKNMSEKWGGGCGQPPVCNNNIHLFNLKEY